MAEYEYSTDVLEEETPDCGEGSAALSLVMPILLIVNAVFARSSSELISGSPLNLIMPAVSLVLVIFFGVRTGEYLLHQLLLFCAEIVLTFVLLSVAGEISRNLSNLFSAVLPCVFPLFDLAFYRVKCGSWKTASALMLCDPAFAFLIAFLPFIEILWK